MSKSNNRRQKPEAKSQAANPVLNNQNGDLGVGALTLYIDNKVDSKVAEGVKELRRKFWPNTIIIALSSLAAIWWLFQSITNEMQKRLTSAYVADTLNKHIAKFTDEKVASVADNRISTAEKRIIEGFEKKVTEQEAMLARSSAEADAQIQSLKSALGVMKKAYDARGGDRRAFDEIAILSTNKTEAGEIAAKVIHEIETAYSSRKEKENTGFFASTRQTVAYNGKDGRQGPISFADASRIVISHFRDFEEGAIHRLADSGQKEFVEVLMFAVTGSSRLDSVYHALRGIEKLSGTTFPILGIDEASAWWKENKDKPEYRSPYAVVWTMFLQEKLRQQPNESSAEYYRRVVIPLHEAVVIKQDLDEIAKIILPIAFGYGLDLLGKVEGVDCTAITKDLISHLGNDAEARKLEFRYTLDTMALYQKLTGDPLFNYAIRSIKANVNLLEELKTDKFFTPQFKKRVEDVLTILDQHTKGIQFYCAMNQHPNGDTQFMSQIIDGNETLHNLNLIARKNMTFVIHSADDMEVPSGELGIIPFKTGSKEGRILLLNAKGIPILFDVQFDKK